MSDIGKESSAPSISAIDCYLIITLRAHLDSRIKEAHDRVERLYQAKAIAEKLNLLDSPYNTLLKLTEW